MHMNIIFMVMADDDDNVQRAIAIWFAPFSVSSVLIGQRSS